MSDSSPIPSVPSRPVKRTNSENDNNNEPKVPQRPSRASGSGSGSLQEVPIVPTRPKKNVEADEIEDNSVNPELGQKEVEESDELVATPLIPTRRPIKNSVVPEGHLSPALTNDHVEEEDLNELPDNNQSPSVINESDQEVDLDNSDEVLLSPAVNADNDQEEDLSKLPKVLLSTTLNNDDAQQEEISKSPNEVGSATVEEELDSQSNEKKEYTHDISVPAPLSDEVQATSQLDPSDLVEEDVVLPSGLVDNVTSIPTISSNVPSRSTTERTEEEAIAPVIPNRPSKSSFTSAVSTPSPSKEEIEHPLSKIPIPSHTEKESMLNSEIDKATDDENETEADGDKTPGNTDMKASFKSFEEDRPASDSSSFNDDVETVLQDRDELGNNGDGTDQLRAEESNEITKDANDTNLPDNELTEKEQTEELAKSDVVQQNPIIPKRPQKPAQKFKEVPTVAENSPLVQKAPPPKPKKLSSKMAAFQEMFNQKAPELKKVSSGSSEPVSLDAKENPSVPKRPSKLSSDKINFGKNINLTGMMGGRGIALPGMADISKLNKGIQDDDEEEKAEKAEPEPVSTADVRKARARGPKGKRLPKSITDTTVDSSSNFEIVIDSLWEVTHVKLEAVLDKVENSDTTTPNHEIPVTETADKEDESFISAEENKVAVKSIESDEEIIPESEVFENFIPEKETDIKEEDGSQELPSKIVQDKDAEDSPSTDFESVGDNLTEGSPVTVSEKISSLSTANEEEDLKNTVNEKAASGSLASKEKANDSFEDIRPDPITEPSNTLSTDLDSLISQAKVEVESYSDEN